MPKYLPMLYTQDEGYFHHFEGLRAIAGLWVIFLHVALFSVIVMGEQAFKQFTDNFWFKVALSSSVSLDTFFFITGFLISYALIKHHQKTGNANIFAFFIRRCARVYPMYLVLLIVCIPISFSTAHSMWANLLQINNALPMNKQYLAWSWSLAVDFHFYFVIGTMLWLRSKNIVSAKPCFALCGALFLLPIVSVIIIIGKNHFDHIHLTNIMLTTPEHHQYFDQLFDKTYTRCGPILIGLYCAYVLVYQQTSLDNITKKLTEVHIELITLVLLLFIVFVVANDPIWSIQHNKESWQTTTFWSIIGERYLFTIALGALILLMHQQRGRIITRINQLLSLKVFRPIGQLTFCAYLIHPPVLIIGALVCFAHQEHCSALEYLQNGLWLMLLTYLLAIPCYLFIEQPAMHKIKSAFPRRD